MSSYFWFCHSLFHASTRRVAIAGLRDESTRTFFVCKMCRPSRNVNYKTAIMSKHVFSSSLSWYSYYLFQAYIQDSFSSIQWTKAFICNWRFILVCMECKAYSKAARGYVIYSPMATPMIACNRDIELCLFVWFCKVVNTFVRLHNVPFVLPYFHGLSLPYNVR